MARAAWSVERTSALRHTRHAPRQMSSPTIIHLVRHGYVHNPTAIVYGRLPRFRLSDEGKSQAQAAGKALGRKPLVAIYSSPLLRARQTAQAIQGFHTALQVRLVPLIIEISSPYDGVKISDMEARNWDLYSGNSQPHEQPEHIANRGRQFLQRMRSTHAGQQVVAVTHGDVLAFTIMWAKGERPDWRRKAQMSRFGFSDNYPQTASITTFTFHTDSDTELPNVSYVKPYVS